MIDFSLHTKKEWKKWKKMTPLQHRNLVLRNKEKWFLNMQSLVTAGFRPSVLRSLYPKTLSIYPQWISRTNWQLKNISLWKISCFMFLEFFTWDEKWKPPIKNLFKEEKTCINYLNDFLCPFTGMIESYYPSLPKIRFLSPVFFFVPFFQMPPK